MQQIFLSNLSFFFVLLHLLKVTHIRQKNATDLLLKLCFFLLLHLLKDATHPTEKSSRSDRWSYLYFYYQLLYRFVYFFSFLLLDLLKNATDPAEKVLQIRQKKWYRSDKWSYSSILLPIIIQICVLVRFNEVTFKCSF